MPWGRKTIRSKNRKYPASPLFPFSFFPHLLSAALSTSSTAAFSSDNTNKPNLYTTTNTSSTTGSQHNHQAATTTLSLLLPAFLSPSQTSSCAVATPAAKLSINAATSTTIGPHHLKWFSIPALHQPSLLFTAAVAAYRIHSACSD